MASLVEVRDLTKRYKTGGNGFLDVLRGLSFDIHAGEVVAVVGESGAGKSTLLHILGTLDRPTSGSVLFKQQDVFRKNNEALAAFRNQAIGFVFQFHHLLPEFTALENVAMPALIQNRRLADVQGRASELLQALGLAERADHRPSALSGGEQQRVAIARALMNQPDLILMDEPTGNLDANTAEALHAEILRLSRNFGQTFVIVTHNAALAGMADRIMRLNRGLIAEDPVPRSTVDDGGSGLDVDL
ncbi:MAG TPA: ABC transporter ATP-binding protein [Rhodothermales bacterium]|nr:ABC transporter ATP-binding protein [Rhodothermales bacterium]